MTEISKILPEQAPSSNATYNFSDIEEGTGTIIYFGGSNKADITSGYFLSKNALYSNDLNTQATANTGSFAKVLDLDFDVKFNLPQDLKGFVNINIPLGGRTTGAAPNAWSVYAIIILRHWDGSTETDIAQVQTETVSGGGGAADVKESKVLNAQIDASSSLTHFKKGDTLRVTVEIYGNNVSGAGEEVGLGNDPKGRTDETAANGGIIEDSHSTVFEIHVPFLLKDL